MYSSCVPSCAVTLIFTSTSSVVLAIVVLDVPTTSGLVAICTFAFGSSGITYTSKLVSFLFTLATYLFVGTASAGVPFTFTLINLTLSGNA